ncbi:hypothetical protein [Teichococcus aestuarii]|uniref:Uncharacterized protein n=1 Tax=Teichococcus aestuarii TaxID=568898 RepID=A0A2U1UZQ9_9PROT|nr:hypothetical protein [Pseudoroseomonas aestuarii]PWC27146.1 hypothetical protein CR165_19510 [Pseudoroseomonas aestuarii]
MLTRTVDCPVALRADPSLAQSYKGRDVTITVAKGQPPRLVITAPDEAALDQVEVWLAQMDTPAD